MSLRLRQLAPAVATPLSLLLGLAFTASAAGAEVSGGQQVFNVYCAACHMENAQPPGSPNEKAPTRAQLRQFTAEAVLTALTNGKMQVQGSMLSDAQRRQVAEFATGKRLSVVAASGGSASTAARAPRPWAIPRAARAGTGIGNGPPPRASSDRKAGGLTAADLPRLKLKWAFGYADVGAARAQPTVAGGRLFVASENGEVHALNPATGCTYWTFKAQAGVRTAPFVAPYRAAGQARPRRCSSVTAARMSTAWMRRRGTLLWTRKIDDHASAGDHRRARSCTTAACSSACRASARKVAAPPMAIPAARSAAAWSALDATTGELLWKTYTIDEPAPRGEEQGRRADVRPGRRRASGPRLRST